MLEVLLFLLIGILGYVAVVLTVQMKALRRQVDSYKNMENFLVEWLGELQKERQAGKLEIAAEARALRKTAQLFLKTVHFAPSYGSTYSQRDLQTLLDGVRDQDERLTGTG